MLFRLSRCCVHSTPTVEMWFIAKWSLISFCDWLFLYLYSVDHTWGQHLDLWRSHTHTHTRPDPHTHSFVFAHTAFWLISVKGLCVLAPKFDATALRRASLFFLFPLIICLIRKSEIRIGTQRDKTEQDAWDIVGAALCRAWWWGGGSFVLNVCAQSSGCCPESTKESFWAWVWSRFRRTKSVHFIHRTGYCYYYY